MTMTCLPRGVIAQEAQKHEQQTPIYANYSILTASTEFHAQMIAFTYTSTCKTVTGYMFDTHLVYDEDLHARNSKLTTLHVTLHVTVQITLCQDVNFNTCMLHPHPCVFVLVHLTYCVYHPTSSEQHAGPEY